VPGARLEKVGPDNLARFGFGCLTNPKNIGFQPKVVWLQARFAEGLRLLLFRDDQDHPLAFLEYTPGEYAWRPVEANGWFFVHCLWVYSKGQKLGGLGLRLIDACVEEARKAGALGVAAMTSDGPWMVGKQVFIKRGFEVVARASRFELVVLRLRPGPAPRFREVGKRPAGRRGLEIVYSAQCPMLPKSVLDLSEIAAGLGLKLKVTQLKSAREAQAAPSLYGVFSLLWNGRLLADHYVSGTRFRNILREEGIGQPKRPRAGPKESGDADRRPARRNPSVSV